MTHQRASQGTIVSLEDSETIRLTPRTKGERQIPQVWTDYSFPTKRSSTSPVTLLALLDGKTLACARRSAGGQKENRVERGSRTSNRRTGKRNQDIPSGRDDRAAWARTRLSELGSDGSHRRQIQHFGRNLDPECKTVAWLTRNVGWVIRFSVRSDGLTRYREYHGYVPETMRWAVAGKNQRE